MRAEAARRAGDMRGQRRCCRARIKILAVRKKIARDICLPRGILRHTALRMTDDPPIEEVSAKESSALTQEAPSPASEEEQMAAFEEALKEADWGHQPC